MRDYRMIECVGGFLTSLSTCNSVSDTVGVSTVKVLLHEKNGISDLYKLRYYSFTSYDVRDQISSCFLELAEMLF